jgi:hypothetical protein
VRKLLETVKAQQMKRQDAQRDAWVILAMLAIAELFLIVPTIFGCFR